jgi:hypothetical protein
MVDGDMIQDRDRSFGKTLITSRIEELEWVKKTLQGKFGMSSTSSLISTSRANSRTQE